MKKFETQGVLANGCPRVSPIAIIDGWGPLRIIRGQIELLRICYIDHEASLVTNMVFSMEGFTNRSSIL